ncbi:hypothetical protein MRX96_041412 [Rhipicephalus microplus]
MSGLAGNDTPAAGDAVDHLLRSLESLSGLAGNDTPAAGDAVDHLRRSLKSLSGLAGNDTPAGGDSVDHLRRSLKSLPGLAGNDTPAADDAVDHLRCSLKSLSGLAGNDTPAAGDAVDHLHRSLKSLGPEAAVPELKPATPVKNRRTFIVQSINGTLVMIARQQERPTNQNPGASRDTGSESPPAAAAVASKAPTEAYDILEAGVSWNEAHSK